MEKVRLGSLVLGDKFKFIKQPKGATVKDLNSKYIVMANEGGEDVAVDRHPARGDYTRVPSSESVLDVEC